MEILLQLSAKFVAQSFMTKKILECQMLFSMDIEIS